jgi:hypothetical protein
MPYLIHPGSHNGLVRTVLAFWGRPEVIGPLSGGHRNPVLELRRGRERLVARWSRRSPAGLDWEIGLLDHLAQHGLRVPEVVAAPDGRRHVDGVVVQTWLDGTPPGPADRPAVAAAVRHLHEVTAHWPQRPGFASTLVRPGGPSRPGRRPAAGESSPAMPVVSSRCSAGRPGSARPGRPGEPVRVGERARVAADHQPVRSRAVRGDAGVLGQRPAPVERQLDRA